MSGLNTFISLLFTFVLAHSAARNVLDGHVHITDLTKLSYTWQKTLPKLDHSWSLQNYTYAIDKAEVQPNVVVFIEVSAVSTDWEKEVEWVQSVADENPSPSIGAIIAHAPIQMGKQVAPILDTYIAKAPLLRGIRQGESVNFFNDTSFLEGLQELGKRGLSFDLLLSDIKKVLPVVKSVPGTRFILDHIGSPKIAQNDFDSWAEDISLLAKYPNVYCKVSGVPSEASGGSYGNWTIDEIRPYVVHAIKSFGYERCLFGGNWFFLNLAGTFVQWSHALEYILDKDLHATTEEKELIYWKTGVKAYNVNV